MWMPCFKGVSGMACECFMFQVHPRYFGVIQAPLVLCVHLILQHDLLPGIFGIRCSNLLLTACRKYV